MEPHNTSYNSADGGPFLYDELEDMDSETLVTGEGPSTSKAKRQFWTVQVRNGQGEVAERSMRIRDIFSLPRGETVIIPFDGSTPSGTDADGLLGGFLGRLAQNYRYFPISFKKWPKVLQTSKDWVWANVIKVFGCRYQRFCGTSNSSNTSEQNRVAQLENVVQELRSELETRDVKMKKVEVLLTHILMNSSIPVPPDLAGSLDIQTPGAQPSSQLDINQLG
ncbi:hypothetical protein SESBI_23198 [Sesbania bispinosa]|nr:hypothetical protein SESBI_23198 [Sesbania bispinosa]